MQFAAQIVGKSAQVFGLRPFNHTRPFVVFQAFAPRNSVEKISDRSGNDCFCRHKLFG
jgi:hypothetical protein